MFCGNREGISGLPCSNLKMCRCSVLYSIIIYWNAFIDSWISNDLPTYSTELGTCGYFVFHSIMNKGIFGIFFLVNLTGDGLFKKSWPRNRLHNIYNNINFIYIYNYTAELQNPNARPCMIFAIVPARWFTSTSVRRPSSVYWIFSTNSLHIF